MNLALIALDVVVCRLLHGWPDVNHEVSLADQGYAT
jgi:hypothetical protein